MRGTPNRKVRININTTQEVRDRVAELLIEAGYIHGDSPAWGKFIEDICDRRILVYQQIDGQNITETFQRLK